MSDTYLPRSAGDDVLAAIDAILASNENALTVPLTKISQAVAQIVEANGKAVSKFTTKILRDADKRIVANDNHLDGVTTTILQGIDSWLGDTEYLLQQLTSKSGLTELGEPVAAALTKEATEGRQLTYEGTLVLKVAEAVPWLERIACACERIARALEGTSPVTLPSNLGDSAAEAGEDEEDWPEIDVEECVTAIGKDGFFPML